MNEEGMFALAHRIRNHAKGMERRERLAYLTRMLWGSTYGWGDEVIGSTDCSGSVFWSLWLMGYEVRVTAHELEGKYTVPVEKPEAGDLAFWWDGPKVVHVAVFTDNRIVLNASPPKMYDVSVEEEKTKRSYRKLRYAHRRVNWEALDADREEGRLKAWGVGKELRPLLGLMEGED